MRNQNSGSLVERVGQGRSSRRGAQPFGIDVQKLYRAELLMHGQRGPQVLSQIVDGERATRSFVGDGLDTNGIFELFGIRTGPDILRKLGQGNSRLGEEIIRRAYDEAMRKGVTGQYRSTTRSQKMAFLVLAGDVALQNKIQRSIGNWGTAHANDHSRGATLTAMGYFGGYFNFEAGREVTYKDMKAIVAQHGITAEQVRDLAPLFVQRFGNYSVSILAQFGLRDGLIIQYSLARDGESLSDLMQTGSVYYNKDTGQIRYVRDGVHNLRKGINPGPGGRIESGFFESHNGSFQSFTFRVIRREDLMPVQVKPNYMVARYQS